MNNFLPPDNLNLASYKLSPLGHRLKYIALYKVSETGRAKISISQTNWLFTYPDTKNVVYAMKQSVKNLANAEVDFGPHVGSHRFLISGLYIAKSKSLELVFCPKFLKACGL